MELGSTFESCTQDDSGVNVVIHKVRDGKETIEEARFKYVVGADGGKSKSRF